MSIININAFKLFLKIFNNLVFFKEPSDITFIDFISECVNDNIV